MGQSPGLLDSLRSLAQGLVGALQTRLELLANELEEQGTRIVQIVLLWVLAGFCLALAVVLGTMLLVVLYWESHRLVVLAVLIALFGGGGIAALLAARSLARSRPRAFSGTLDELARDRDTLGS